ncbi:Uncharacterised protein [Dorea longicatena]|nr:Uncharacterised protein [Dorea longicatena]
MYVPAWMKQDTDTYFHVRKVNGESINTISPFCEAAIEKDANAFAKVMAHIREIDEQKSTVIIHGMQGLIHQEVRSKRCIIFGKL